MHEQPLKPFRWVGRPSEEELLGIPFPVPSGTGRQAPRRAPAAPPRRSAAPPPPPSRRRLRPGEVLALLAVAAVAALALGGPGKGVRFSAAQPLTAPEARDPHPTRVTVATERTVMLSSPIKTPRAATSPRATRAPRKPGATSASQPAPKPAEQAPEEPAEEQARELLLEAELPLLGTVAVEQPALLEEELTPATELADTLLP